jgi:hypothetical protein
MLWRTAAIKGFKIHGSNGQVGAVTDLLFDDKTWMTKWLAAHAGPWLFGRHVLLRVSVLEKPDDDARQVRVQLTHQQVKDSPDARTDPPVSRSMDVDVYSYDDRLPVWQSGDSPRGLRPEGTPVFMPRMGLGPDPFCHGGASTPGVTVDPSLRSATDVKGYHMAATDGAIGHIEDFLFDDIDWRIKYLGIDTKNWLPGLDVVIAPSAIREISSAMRSIYLNVDRETGKRSPPYGSLTKSELSHFGGS